MSFAARWTFAIVISAAACVADDEAEFHPLFDQARLVVGDEELAPIEVISPWRDYKRVGDRLFYVDGPRVVEVADDYSTVVNEIASTDGLDLAWFAMWKGTAYFATRRRDEQYPDEHVWDVYPDPVIHRLNLDTMTWLTPLEIQPEETSAEIEVDGFDGTDDEPSHWFLGHVLVTDDLVDVLTYEVTRPVGETSWWGDRVIGYQVTQFWHGEEQPVWAARFKAVGPFAIRSGPLYNRGWQTAISPLIAVERDKYPAPLLIICAGNHEDLVALSRESGEELWRISRLWEYEPGYYPSEYDPYVTRFGVTRWVERIAEDKSERSIGELSDEDWSAVQKYLNRRSRFRREVESRMVAGPVFVPDKGIFVGVERRQRSIGGGEHPAEGIVYQIDPESGEPEAWVRLPSQLSDEIAPIADDAGSVWFCRDGGVARLLPRSDLYLPVDWYKSLPSGARPVEEFVGMPTDLNGSVFVRFGTAGYVSRARSQPYTYEQRVEFINMLDGHGILAVLVVPLEPPAESPYAYASRGAPYYAESVDLSDNRLELTIRSAVDVFSLRFDISPIMSQFDDP
jgi:hypothetical protein